MSKKRGNRKTKLGLIVALLFLMCIAAAAVIVLMPNATSEKRKAKKEAATQAISTGVSAASSEIVTASNEMLTDYLVAERVYSHRGSAGLNEHSFEAYDAAIAAGSHNIEQDIVISKDGTLYVSHDLSAAYITGTDRLYSDMTDDEIDALSTNNGGHVLKLREVFEKYGRSVHYLIDLKSEDDATVEAFREELDTAGIADITIAQSLEVGVLDKLEEIYPDMPKLLVVKTEAALQQALDSENVDIVGARVQFVNESNCKEAHDKGKKFVGWTLDSEDEIRNAIDIGADAYFTNDTPLALKLERQYRPVELAINSKDTLSDSSNEGANGSGHSTIFFASDYQKEDGFEEPKDTLRALIKSAILDGKDPGMAVICGDYTNDASLHDYQLSPEDSISEIRNVLREEAAQLSDDNMLFVQGNHDKLTESISESGLHEYDNYLIYILNTENDFPWKQGKVAGCHDKVKAAAEAMKNCFDGLIAKGETRPVIIAAHVPLHFTARTSSRHTTGDNLYSSLVFDVINQAAEQLDIIYMYGHNHSKGWDCYMGGACVYKTIGDTLLLPVFTDSDVNTDRYEEKTLNFTYLNAGYTGYYMNCAPSEYSGDEDSPYRTADETLTATVLDIYDDRIEIARYDANGRHVLGAAGASNPYKGGIDADLIESRYYSKESAEQAAIERKSRAEGAVENPGEEDRLDDAA